MVDCCIFVVLSLTSFLPFLFVNRNQTVGRRNDGDQSAEEEAVGIWSRELVRHYFDCLVDLFFSSQLLLISNR